MIYAAPIGFSLGAEISHGATSEMWHRLSTEEVTRKSSAKQSWTKGKVSFFQNKVLMYLTDYF